MPLKVCNVDYTDTLINSAKTEYFVFSDNKVRAGFGGQAAACRVRGAHGRHQNKVNCIGIRTKHAPVMDERVFFSDQPDELRMIAEDLGRVENLLRLGETVWWPYTGIGTGLSELPERAPKCYALILGFYAKASKEYA